MAFISTHRSTSCKHPTRRVSILDLLALHRQRRALARLDDRSLDDIGVTRAQADAEAGSGFWDVPSHWIK